MTPGEVSDLEWLLAEIDRLPIDPLAKASVIDTLCRLAGQRVYFSGRLLLRAARVREVVRMLNAGVTRAQARERLEQWRPEFYKTCNADDQEAKKKAFQRVRGDLVQLGRLSLEHDFYRCPMGDTGLNAARLLASFAPAGTRDRDGTEPGHVPHSHPT